MLLDRDGGSEAARQMVDVLGWRRQVDQVKAGNGEMRDAGGNFRGALALAVSVATALIVSPGMAVAKPSVQIASVSTSGTSAKPEITVNGHGFGHRPAPNPAHFSAAAKAMGCPVVPAAKAGHLYGTQLYLTDLKAKKGTYTNWTAGQYTPGGNGFFDCVGLVIDQWSNTRVRFHFGATYGKSFPQNKYFLSNGDRFKVFVRHATFVRKAKLG